MGQYIYRQLPEFKTSDHSVFRWFIILYKEWLIWSNRPTIQMVEFECFMKTEILKY